mgnify:CR=1 FL=1
MKLATKEIADSHLGLPETQRRMIYERGERISGVGFDYESTHKIWNRYCNLCRGTRFEPVCNFDRYGYKVPLVRCTGCHLRFINPRMSASEYDTFYLKHYRNLTKAYTGAEDPEQHLLSHQQDMIKTIGPQLTELQARSGARYLDIGGGSGVKASMLAEMWNLDPHIIDPNETEVEDAKKRGVHATLGRFEEYEGEPFDVITLFQTVEHFLNPRAAFVKIGRLMKPNGVFIFDIIDFEERARQWPLEQVAKVDHPFWFTPGTISEYVRLANLDDMRPHDTFRYNTGHQIMYVCTSGRKW